MKIYFYNRARDNCGGLISAGAFQYMGAEESCVHIEIMTAIKCRV